jgi:hypothetical protein
MATASVATSAIMARVAGKKGAWWALADAPVLRELTSA